MDCFAGFADGIATYLSIKGLEVDDLERIKAPALRKTSSHSVRMVVSRRVRNYKYRPQESTIKSLQLTRL